VLALYLVYLVRTPSGYTLLGAFVAIAASGLVNLLSRKLPRGFAIATVYLGIVFVPIIIALILVPRAVEQGVKLANKLPRYAKDLNEALDKNPQLKEANEVRHHQVARERRR
jgi:predicted PurR-regulated permease PerM